jgi:hypothetical protein
VLIDMVFLRVMDVAVMQIIDVITVAHGGMAAVRSEVAPSVRTAGSGFVVGSSAVLSS